ncbi:uncharacterized protein MAM_03624 [Metarhizium album ARSEF 1941]|uniref:Uncharacterized protein n=1 Tax=Metarhizium album (strain ARSEF 1941) TaxID=1081103 RepID=A0A0B2X083_METAS|nr:uncharacterized protein MAM_03624 [Metarhizium album ARSEF 1941]KHN98500.1 hypothetical protein MAM_03624 [Metarhizium album ARSEF 1941]
MAVTSSSQSTPDVRFPIVCTADIEAEILRDLLSGDKLVLVAKRDLWELITNRDDDRLESFISPFTEDIPDAHDCLCEFMDAVKSRDYGHISHKSFVILDDTTDDDGTTCQIAVDGREEEESNDIHIAFRCELASAADALAAIQASSENQLTKVVRDLRNEATMIGGVWSKQRADEFRSRPSHIDTGDYPPHQDWGTDGDAEGRDTDPPCIPIFQTAKTLNQFLEETYDQDWGDEETATPHMAFVTSLREAPFHSGKAGNFQESAPQVPPALLGASAVECDAIVRSLFPGEPETNCNLFIALDEFTETEKTVIVASNRELDGQLLLGRADFRSALAVLVAPADTRLTVDSQINRAVAEGPGVIRDD